MARQVNVTLVDDLDGKSLAQETVEFTVDGVCYEIDLCNKNADKLRKELEPWIGSARKVTGRFKGRRPAVAGSREDLSAVRQWASENGMSVSSRGRIPGEIITAYHNRNSGTVKSDKQRTAAALAKVTPIDAADSPEFSAAK